MGCILTRLNGLECPNDTSNDLGCFVTHLQLEGWDEHSKDGLECLADTCKPLGMKGASNTLRGLE